MHEIRAGKTAIVISSNVGCVSIGWNFRFWLCAMCFRFPEAVIIPGSKDRFPSTGKPIQRFKAPTDSKHRLPVGPNLLNRDSHPAKPDESHAVEMPPARATGGRLYL